MASPTQWRWVWVNSRSWWWTGRPGVLQSMGSQRVRHDWATELSWIELNWITIQAFPGGSDGKESTFNAGNPGSIPGSGRSPGEGNGNPLHCSCLENSMDRETWGPQSTGSQRVGRDWMTNTITAEAYRSRVGWPLRIWPQAPLRTWTVADPSTPPAALRTVPTAATWCSQGLPWNHATFSDPNQSLLNQYLNFLSAPIINLDK